MIRDPSAVLTLYKCTYFVPSYIKVNLVSLDNQEKRLLVKNLGSNFFCEKIGLKFTFSFI